MSYAERHSIAVTTAVGGAATVYSPIVTGRVASIAYVKTDFADGVDFSITGADSGVVIWAEDNVNAAKVMSPVQAAHLNTSGAASAFTQNPVVVANERIKIIIAAGGDGKIGTFNIVMA